MMRLRNGSALIWLAATSSCLAHATTIYDNTAAVTNGSDPVASPLYGYFGPLYDSFTTGADDEVLVDLQLLLSGNPASSGSIDIGLYADSSTALGIEIDDFGTLDDSSLTSNPALYDIPTGDPALAPDTRYWIGLSDNSASGITTAFWAWSTDTSGPGAIDEFFANSDGVFENTSNGPYQMSVSVTAAVPEPGTVYLVLLGAYLLQQLVFTRRARA